MGDLLRTLEIRLDQVAVEINLEIMEKSDFESRVLAANDRVEVMSFIGGGSLGFVPLIKLLGNNQNLSPFYHGALNLLK